MYAFCLIAVLVFVFLKNCLHVMNIKYTSQGPMQLFCGA